jgi:ribulose-bisphosphate carboxylase large chain
MTLPQRLSVPNLSGERFRVRYLLTGTEEEARATAEVVCVEQTAEFPAALIPDGDIRDHIVGQLEDFEASGAGRGVERFAATISFAVESAGSDLPQLFNLLLGTTGLQSGIRVDRFELPDSLLALYRGPRFGQRGWREVLHVPDRPLLCTAIKPMGLSPQHLADMAYRCALGGLDIIKDDHGITDLAFCPFEERVERCSEAVAKANRETGLHCVYAANVTTSADRIVERALFAKQAGAGALMIAPGLTGFDAMRQLADDGRIGLPILSHPTFCGSLVFHPNGGFSHYAFYGQMQRLAGADASIYANYGGRFSVSREDCQAIIDGCRDPMGHIKPIHPVPGGGMTLKRIPELREMYGSEVIFLVGGGLHTAGDDLAANVRQFVELVQ